jgi:hypothetical protein
MAGGREAEESLPPWHRLRIVGGRVEKNKGMRTSDFRTPNDSFLFQLFGPRPCGFAFCIELFASASLDTGQNAVILKADKTSPV